MSVFLLLDILLLILIALPIPIGFWRGAQREAFVTLGILFGAALSDWWARPWGRELAALTQLSENGGAFMVAVLFLVGSTFLLGYSAGAAFPFPSPGIIGRIFGGLLAAGNFALLLSFALRNIRIYLLPDQDVGFLERAFVANFLSTSVGWMLLGAAVLFMPIVLALALFGRSTVIEEYDDDYDDEYEEQYTPTRRHFPPRSPVSPTIETDAIYKAEAPRMQPYSPVEDTRPIVIGARDQSSPGAGGDDRTTDEHPMAAHHERNHQSEPGESDAERTLQFSPKDDDVPARVIPDGRCPNCRADVMDAELYCPRCGQVL